MLMLLDGKHRHEQVTEKPELDSVEIWRLMNRRSRDDRPHHREIRGYTGRYVWRCHLLEHASSEMMRPFEVVARSRSGS